MPKPDDDYTRVEVETLMTELQETIETLRERGMGAEPMYERVLRIDQGLQLVEASAPTSYRTMQLMTAVCIAVMVEDK